MFEKNKFTEDVEQTPSMLKGNPTPLSLGFPLQNGNLKQQIMILMIMLEEGSECELVEPRRPYLS
jgi:hypothetical protein